MRWNKGTPLSCGVPLFLLSDSMLVLKYMRIREVDIMTAEIGRYYKVDTSVSNYEKEVAEFNSLCRYLKDVTKHLYNIRTMDRTDLYDLFYIKKALMGILSKNPENRTVEKTALQVYGKVELFTYALEEADIRAVMERKLHGGGHTPAKLDYTTRYKYWGLLSVDAVGVSNNVFADIITGILRGEAGSLMRRFVPETYKLSIKIEDSVRYGRAYTKDKLIEKDRATIAYDLLLELASWHKKYEIFQDKSKFNFIDKIEGLKERVLWFEGIEHVKAVADTEYLFKEVVEKYQELTGGVLPY